MQLRRIIDCANQYLDTHRFSFETDVNQPRSQGKALGTRLDVNKSNYGCSFVFSCLWLFQFSA